jgi:hypothetical protein
VIPSPGNVRTSTVKRPVPAAQRDELARMNCAQVVVRLRSGAGGIRDGAEQCRPFDRRRDIPDWRAPRQSGHSPGDRFSLAIRTINSSTSLSIGGRPERRCARSGPSTWMASRSGGYPRHPLASTRTQSPRPDRYYRRDEAAAPRPVLLALSTLGKRPARSTPGSNDRARWVPERLASCCR